MDADTRETTDASGCFATVKNYMIITMIRIRSSIILTCYVGSALVSRRDKH